MFCLELLNVNVKNLAFRIELKDAEEQSVTSFYQSIHGLSPRATLSLCLILSSVFQKKNKQKKHRKRIKRASFNPCFHSVSWLKGKKVRAACYSFNDCKLWDNLGRQVGHTWKLRRPWWQNIAPLQYQVGFFWGENFWRNNTS